MAYKLVLVLTRHCLVKVIYSKEHLVQTNCTSHSNSCRTFNDYANDADTYFTSDSSFYFMKGTHHLNVAHIIRNVVSLSFVGNKSYIILSNGCSIIGTNSSLFWTSLSIIFRKAYENTNYAAVHFKNSESVFFSNASFIKFYCEHDIFSRAILVVGSSIIFESCMIENGYHFTGGTLYIEDSNVTFKGHNVFLNNTANISAGAMYGLRSQIQLSGKNTFKRNRIVMEEYKYNCNGTVIHVEFSNISLNGYFKFHYNQIIENSGCFYSFGHGGAIAASYSTLTTQRVSYFINNSNISGGAIYLLNSECLISGHVEFEGNVALGGVP